MAQVVLEDHCKGHFFFPHCFFLALFLVFLFSSFFSLFFFFLFGIFIPSVTSSRLFPSLRPTFELVNFLPILLHLQTATIFPPNLQPPNIALLPTNLTSATVRKSKAVLRHSFASIISKQPPDPSVSRDHRPLCHPRTRQTNRISHEHIISRIRARKTIRSKKRHPVSKA